MGHPLIDDAPRTNVYPLVRLNTISVCPLQHALAKFPSCRKRLLRDTWNSVRLRKMKDCVDFGVAASSAWKHIAVQANRVFFMQGASQSNCQFTRTVPPHPSRLHHCSFQAANPRAWKPKSAQRSNLTQAECSENQCANTDIRFPALGVCLTCRLRRPQCQPTQSKGDFSNSETLPPKLQKNKRTTDIEGFLSKKHNQPFPFLGGVTASCQGFWRPAIAFCKLQVPPLFLFGRFLKASAAHKAAHTAPDVM